MAAAVLEGLKRCCSAWQLDPGDIPLLLVPVTQAPHNNRAFSELLSTGQGPAGDACAGPISLCGSCVQACMLRWGEWVVDRVATAPRRPSPDKLPLSPAWTPLALSAFISLLPRGLPYSTLPCLCDPLPSEGAGVPGAPLCLHPHRRSGPLCPC